MTQEHDTIRTTIAALRDEMRKEPAEAFPGLSQLRWRLTRDLLLHMATERVHFRRCGLDGDEAWDAPTIEMRYRQHLARWTINDIQRHWDAFVVELDDMLDAVERCMAYEEGHMYPALAAAAATARAKGGTRLH